MDVYKIHRSGGEVHGTENMPKSKLQVQVYFDIL